MTEAGTDETVFPPPESGAGWRCVTTDEETRELTGFDPSVLDVTFGVHDRLYGGDIWGLVVIRHGWLVREHATFTVASSTRFDIWSATKSFTATAWGLFLSELPDARVTLDTPIYELLPEGWPLSDPRKRHITLRHVLSMTSGIAGELHGMHGLINAMSCGAYEHALGHAPDRYGRWAAELVADAGTHWEYSDAAFAHLSPAFARAAGQEIASYLAERVLHPIGIENVAWDQQGGSGFLGPHTNPHTGLHLSARDLARFGYLTLHDGVWDGSRLLPDGWVQAATTPSQDLNPAYGLAYWTNAAGAWHPGLPEDLYGFAGFAGNRCFVIPSLDLVIARVGTGPALLEDGSVLNGVLRALLDA